jgi:hypothetical protein
MNAIGRTRLRMLATMAAGALGFLAGAYGLGIGGWPATIAFGCGAGLIAATISSDRMGFLGAWLGALAAASALTITGGHISDPEFGIGFAAFIVAAGTLIDGVALGASFLIAALIHRSMPSRADLAVLALGGALLLLGPLVVGLAPGVHPVVPLAVTKSAGSGLAMGRPRSGPGLATPVSTGGWRPKVAGPAWHRA